MISSRCQEPTDLFSVGKLIADYLQSRWSCMGTWRNTFMSSDPMIVVLVKIMIYYQALRLFNQSTAQGQWILKPLDMSLYPCAKFSTMDRVLHCNEDKPKATVFI